MGRLLVARPCSIIISFMPICLKLQADIVSDPAMIPMNLILRSLILGSILTAFRTFVNLVCECFVSIHYVDIIYLPIKLSFTFDSVHLSSPVYRMYEGWSHYAFSPSLPLLTHKRLWRVRNHFGNSIRKHDRHFCADFLYAFYKWCRLWSFIHWYTFLLLQHTFRQYEDYSWFHFA